MKRKSKTPKRLQDLPPELRGPVQNKWGGYRTSRLRGFRGNTYGAASKGNSLSETARKAWAEANGFKCRSKS
jgi:hypothetical protein